MKLELQPIKFDEACAFVRKYHRHHRPPIAAAWRAARAMGYRRLISYTLSSESGRSLIAAGYTAMYQTQGGPWNRKGRPRVDNHPTGPKTLWDQNEE